MIGPFAFQKSRLRAIVNQINAAFQPQIGIIYSYALLLLSNASRKHKIFAPLAARLTI